MTPRQLEALRTADIVACEDSRTTGKLFELLGIPRDDGKPRFVPYHEHNEAERTQSLIAALQAGERVVLVSDAGTPAISDPGYRVVRAARDAGIKVEVLPGPVAAVLAVAGSGLPVDRWTFEGFLPAKVGPRRAALERARATGATAVFYESPRRVGNALAEIAMVYGAAQQVCVARELTKLHEEWRTGSAAALAEELADGTRGEVVVVVGPAADEPPDDIDAWIAAMVAANLAPAQIKSVVSTVTGLSKSDVFARMERFKR